MDQNDQNRVVAMDIVSDVICPWCYIGKRRLEKAMALMEGIDLAITWRPFQLDPTIPPEGRDRKTYLEAKFGGPERAAEIYGNISRAGADEGLAFDFDAIKTTPNTLNAHRLLRWSHAADPALQNALSEHLFDLYFCRGKDIGDTEILVEAARHCGMETEGLAERLKGDEDLDTVKSEIERAQRLGVTGVPCFIVNGRYAVMGAQDPQVLADTITKAAQEQPSQELAGA